jgi:hypothetical protein
MAKDGSTRENKSDENDKRVTGKKTLANVYWILWGPVRIPFFRLGFRMGSQGTFQGTKNGKCLTGRKH